MNADQPKPALNDAEAQLLIMIRNLRVFDCLEIKLVKHGELLWHLVKSDKGTLHVPVDNEARLKK